MFWIALSPPEEACDAWGWHALRFTPRVTQMEATLLLEVSGSERLWGGRQRLMHHLLQPEELPEAPWATGATGRIALALLRLKLCGQPTPTRIPHDLPVHTLNAARAHAATLERTGCRSWDELRTLPRASVARRFGAALLDALDMAWGVQPEVYPWLTLPEHFNQKIELPALATSAPELAGAARHLLAQLRVWLQSRAHGILALELVWALDLRRLNGLALPLTEKLDIRTAQPTQDMGHLQRLVEEHLARTQLAAPACQLRLRSLDTTPWAGTNTSWLPEDSAPGEKLHQLVEHLSARLGEHNVVHPLTQHDHRPEHMQRWVAARTQPPSPPRRESPEKGRFDSLYPTWLLPRPLELKTMNDQPCWHGPLQLLCAEQRIETGWWDTSSEAPASRDYFIAKNEAAGLVWIYRERLRPGPADERWFLHGIYG